MTATRKTHILAKKASTIPLFGTPNPLFTIEKPFSKHSKAFKKSKKTLFYLISKEKNQMKSIKSIKNIIFHRIPYLHTSFQSKQKKLKKHSKTLKNAPFSCLSIYPIHHSTPYTILYHTYLYIPLYTPIEPPIPP